MVRASYFCLKAIVPLILLVLIAAGVLYVRLLNGPISIKVLADPLARSLSNELVDHDVTVEDAILRLTPSGAFEFRLLNLRLLDVEHQPVAIAPLAAISLSTSALWSGRITPERVVLIEPRMLLLMPDAGRQAHSQAHGSGEAVRSGPGGASAAASSDGPVSAVVDGAVLRRVDPIRVLAQATAHARSQTDATAFLKEIGLKQATLVLDYGVEQTVWRVMDAAINLEHRKRYSTIEVNATLASAHGPWQLALRADDNERKKTVSINARVEGLYPSTLMRSGDERASWRALDLPVSGEITAELDADGVLQKAAGEFDLGHGRILLDATTNWGLLVDAGNLALTFHAADRRIEMTSATLRSGASWLALVGALERMPSATQEDEAWRFAIGSTGGVLASDAPGGRAFTLDRFVAEGTIDPRSGSLDLARAVVGVAGSELSLSGRVPGAGQPGGPVFDGHLTPVEIETLQAIWPRAVAPLTREWFRKHVVRGRVTGGILKVGPVLGASARVDDAGRVPSRVALTVEAVDLELRPLKHMPSLEVPRALLNLVDRTLEVSLPDASTIGPPQRKLSFKGARLLVADMSVMPAIGELNGRMSGPLAGAVAALDAEPVALSRQLGSSLESVDGKIDGQMKLVFPLQPDLEFRDLQIEGKARISEGRGRSAIAGLDVQGATVALDIANEAVDLKGEMLLAGVTVKLAAQHLLRVDPQQPQPPIRLSMVLDAADRTQLGLDVNHLITGDIPVEATVVRNSQGETLTQVRAVLTGAELLLEPLAWRKPPGRPATLQFDMARGAGGRTEVQNFKLFGDDIAIGGLLRLDAQNRVREFHFPEFVLNVISQLEVQGNLRQDNVWDVKVKGQTYDGRDFFRSLFSIGRLTESAPHSRPKNRAVEINAEINTVLGFSDVSLRNLRMQVTHRDDRITALNARGVLDGGKSLEASVQNIAGQPRRLVATSEDAGQVFRLVGFYPNAQGGRMRLTVNLDGRGVAEKTGLLEVTDFRILGDPVVSEVLQVRDETVAPTDQPRQGRQRQMRQVIPFDRMRAPFSVGHGQFVLEDADLRGPLVGATLRGKADFKAQSISLGGTYVPLQGLNSALGVIPGLGQILTGPRGEGVLGITFAIQGPMAEPQVIVNPLSLVAPGIFREMFQMTNPTPRVTPRSEAQPGQQDRKSPGSPSIGGGRAAGPDSIGGWSSETTPTTKGQKRIP